MAESVEKRKKLLNRTHRIRGQVDAIIRSIEKESECSEVLHAIAACRGALDSLMVEVINGHIRYHMLDRKKPSDRQAQAAEGLIDALKLYLR